MGKQEDAAKRLKEREQAAKKRFKLPEGVTTFRVLPNAKGLDKREYTEYGMHSSVGPRKAYLRCGKNMKLEGSCWICDTILPKLLGSEKSSKRKAGEMMARKDAFLVQIARKEDDGNWSGPHLWEMPTRVANSLLGVIARKDVAHPDKGYDLTILRKGTGFQDTRYDPIERDDEKSKAAENVLKRLRPFSEVGKKYSEEEQKKAYYGQEQEDDEEETPTRRPQPAETADEDEEAESSTEEDDGETVSTTKKPTVKKPAVEEEEDEDLEPEDDNPKPRDKGKKKPEKEDDDVEELEEDDFADSADVPSLEDDDEPKVKKTVKKPKDEEEEEDDEADSKTTKKGKGKSSEEDDDTEEEEEDEPKSKPKTKKAAAASSHDDDDD